MKRDIHKQTWQHPKSKQWSCIDFVVIKQRDRKLCMDVAARRGAMCNTDHRLVLAKLKLWRSGCRRNVLGGGCGCMDMVIVVRQLAEKAVEHHTKQFFVFVDLCMSHEKPCGWC